MYASNGESGTMSSQIGIEITASANRLLQRLFSCPVLVAVTLSVINLTSGPENDW